MSVYLEGTHVLLASGLVAVNSACCCATTPTGACCPSGSGVCYIDTELGCTNIGNIYEGDGIPCTPNPCVCPDNTSATVRITFTGITLCPSVTGDINGDWIIPFISTGFWGGDISVIVHGPGGTSHAHITAQCQFGALQITAQGGGNFLFFGNGLRPPAFPVSNSLTCGGGFYAQGGTGDIHQV